MALWLGRLPQLGYLCWEYSHWTFNKQHIYFSMWPFRSILVKHIFIVLKRPKKGSFQQINVHINLCPMQHNKSQQKEQVLSCVNVNKLFKKNACSKRHTRYLNFHSQLPLCRYDWIHKLSSDLWDRYESLSVFFEWRIWKGSETEVKVKKVQSRQSWWIEEQPFRKLRYFWVTIFCFSTNRNKYLGCYQFNHWKVRNI